MRYRIKKCTLHLRTEKKKTKQRFTCNQVEERKGGGKVNGTSHHGSYHISWETKKKKKKHGSTKKTFDDLMSRPAIILQGIGQVEGMERGEKQEREKKNQPRKPAYIMAYSCEEKRYRFRRGRRFRPVSRPKEGASQTPVARGKRGKTKR